MPVFMARDAHSQARPLRQSDVRILTEALSGLLACDEAGTIVPIRCGTAQEQILSIRVENGGLTVAAERIPLPPECLARRAGPVSKLD